MKRVLDVDRCTGRTSAVLGVVLCRLGTSSSCLYTAARFIASRRSLIRQVLVSLVQGCRPIRGCRPFRSLCS